MFPNEAKPEKEGFSPFRRDYESSGDVWSLWQSPEETAPEATNWFSWFVDAPIETGADLVLREQQAVVHEAAAGIWDAWFSDAFASEIEIEWGTPVANTPAEYDIQSSGLMRYPELEAGDAFGFDQGGMDATGYGEGGGDY